jgi:nicotinamide riboside transporter PnuC
MNAPHWHLAINHLPVMGVFLVMLLLGYALVSGRGELYGVCLGTLMLLALATVPVFFTGRSADSALMDFTSEYDDKLIHVHEAAAKIAFIGIGVLGVIALVALWFGRRLPHVSRGVASCVFVLVVVETVLMARAANLGGNIRHPEIRASGAAAESDHGKGH